MDKTLQGDDLDDLFGLVGVKVRLVRLKLGEETLELIDFMSQQGDPYPKSSRGRSMDAENGACDQ